MLVAPHGGRRPPINAASPPPHLRVNDVYTPEITRALAEVLDAGWIINRGMDRNALDLNRISQVRRQAVWFLELLGQEIDRLIARHGRAELLFVHGWNTGVPICDIGIGGVATAAGLHAPEGAQLTVDAAYVRDRIGALRAACAGAGIRAPIGERYPGSHRNNLLQLFTARAAAIDHAAAQRIAAWVEQGRLNALQLEMSIALRWPGVWRERFIDAVAQAFACSRQLKVESRKPELDTHSTVDLTLRTQHSALRTASAALQFYDPAVSVGMFAGVGRTGPRATGGRLLLFLGGQRVALFTGEEAHATGNHIGPLTLIGQGDGMRLEFAGPVLLLDDAGVYLDLEAAFAASHLVAAEVRLDFSPLCVSDTARSAQFGRVGGYVAIDGCRLQVESSGFANAAGFRAAGARRQTMIAAAFGSERGVLSRVIDGDNECVGLQFTRRAAYPLSAVRVAVSTDGDRYTPDGFELTCEGQPPLHGAVTSRMAILRPAGNGQYVRVSFGIARYEWAGERGHGLYEYACPIRQ